jgi:hypothetical protein
MEKLKTTTTTKSFSSTKENNTKRLLLSSLATKTVREDTITHSLQQNITNNRTFFSTKKLPTTTTIQQRHSNHQQPHSKTLQKLHKHKREDILKKAEQFEKILFQAPKNAHESASIPWEETKKFMKNNKIEYEPARAICIFLSLTRHLAPSTQRIYLSNIRKIFPKDFEGLIDVYWKRTIKHLLLDTIIQQDKGKGNASTPISAAEVTSLMNNNNIDKNMKNFIFRMWITTARFDDMHKQTVTYHPEQQVVAIKQQGDKTHVKSFIRIAPCSQEQFDRFWKPTIIIPEYPVFMNFLKLHTNSNSSQLQKRIDSTSSTEIQRPRRHHSSLGACVENLSNPIKLRSPQQGLPDPTSHDNNTSQFDLSRW